LDTQLNTIAGWVLAALIAALGLSIVTGMIYAPEPLEKPAYVVEGVVEEDAGAGQAETEKPIAFFLASADPAKGANQFKKCAACHTINAGGPNGIGPNLYGIVGNKVAHSPTFSYSDAVASHGGTWTWDEMSEWLKNPRKHIPGNKMSFAGLSKPEDRADVLVYLNQQSGSPLPLPPVPTESAPATADTAAAPAAEQPAPGPGRAPDVAEENPKPATMAQPETEVGGPGASATVGTSENEPHRP
jgi:cytochrome c